MILRVLIALSSLFAVSDAYSLSYKDALRIVGQSGEGLRFSERDHGALCEVLAIADLEKRFPAAVISSGIKYGPRVGQTMGELDVVIMQGGSATHVIEVKCSKNYSSAASSADRQLTRFQGVAGNCSYDYWDTSYDCDHFQG